MNWYEYLDKILLYLASSGFIGLIIKSSMQRKRLNLESKKLSGLRQKSHAEATQLIVSSAASLVTPLTARLEEAETEAKALKVELQQAIVDLQEARTQIRDLVSQLQRATAENQRVTNENRALRTRLAGGMA